MRNYSERFLEFLGTLPGAESLDDAKALPPTAPLKRADYLLFQRSMTVEVKQLETDPAFKVEAKSTSLCRASIALSVTELMARGRTVFEELSSHFLIGGHGKGDLMEIMRRWSDFFEECELRNIVMRQFSPADPAIDWHAVGFV